MSAIHANEIIPNLWIGNRHTITSPDDFLEDNKIDVIISALAEDEYDDYMIGPPDFVGREWHRLVIDDEPCEEIMVHFDSIHLIIRNALQSNKRVLVHCVAGISRSVTLVAAYLIIEKNITVQEAIDLIVRRREHANPNDGFRWQLEEKYMRIKTQLDNINDFTDINTDSSEDVEHTNDKYEIKDEYKIEDEDEDDNFIPLNISESNIIRMNINDNRFDTTMKYIYECHGDPAGNILYVGGMTFDNKYCIYIKRLLDTFEYDIKITEYEDIIEYLDSLIEIDTVLFNR